MTELLLAAVAAGGGVLAGGLVYLAFRKRAPARSRRPEDEVVTLEILSEETVVPAPTRPFAPEDDPFTYAPPPPQQQQQQQPAPARAAPPEPLPAAHRPLFTRPEPAPRRGVRPTYDPDDPPELPDSPIPTEWARRQVGPVEQGRMKGVCSGCGTSLSVSMARPLRIACPVCGRTRLLPAA